MEESLKLTYWSNCFIPQSELQNSQLVSGGFSIDVLCQVTALQDEKNSLVSENDMMNEKLDQLDGSFDDPNTMVARKYFHAQLQLEQLQEENYR